MRKTAGQIYRFDTEEEVGSIYDPSKSEYKKKKRTNNKKQGLIAASLIHDNGSLRRSCDRRKKQKKKRIWLCFRSRTETGFTNSGGKSE